MSPEKISSDILEIIPFVMRSIRAEMRGLAQPDLSVAQFRILARLDLRAHSNKELAEWIGVSTATMSRTMDGLVNQGFVHRKQTAHDRREVELSLTTRGQKKFETIKSKTKSRLKERILPRSRADRMQLEQGLMILMEIFKNA